MKTNNFTVNQNSSKRKHNSIVQYLQWTVKSHTASNNVKPWTCSQRRRIYIQINLLIIFSQKRGVASHPFHPTKSAPDKNNLKVTLSFWLKAYGNSFVIIYICLFMLVLLISSICLTLHRGSFVGDQIYTFIQKSL